MCSICLIANGFNHLAHMKFDHDFTNVSFIKILQKSTGRVIFLLASARMVDSYVGNFTKKQSDSSDCSALCLWSLYFFVHLFRSHAYSHGFVLVTMVSLPPFLRISDYCM